MPRLIYGNYNGSERPVKVGPDGTLYVDATLEIDEGTAALANAGATTFDHTGDDVSLGTSPKIVVLKNTGDYDADFSWDGGTSWIPLDSGETFGLGCKNTTVSIRARNVGETATVYVQKTE